MGDVNPTSLMQQLLQGYNKTAPGFYNLNASYSPLYTNLNLAGRQQGLFGSVDPTTGQVVQPGSVAQDAAANTSARVSNLSDVLGLGRAGYDTLMQSNPGLGFAIGQANNNSYQNNGPNSLIGILQAHALDDSRSPLLKSLSGVAQDRLGNYQSPLLRSITSNAQSGLSNYRSPLLQSLMGQAQQQIASGGKLSPQETTDLSQGVLSNYAAQGLGTSPSAIAADVLNRDSAQRQRLQAAQQLAGQVQGLDQSALGQAQQFAGAAQGLDESAQGQSQQFAQGVEGLGQNQVQGARGFGLGVQSAIGQNQSLLGQLASLNAGIYDPFQTITGRGSTPIASFGGNSGAGNASAGNFNLSTIFNPNLNDAFMTGFNANQAQDIASQNRNTALITSLLGAAGTAAGAYFSDERLKKNVRKTGEETPTGVPIKEWEYRTDPKKRRWRGVMAQDAEKVRPDAVITDPISGIKAVNYSRLGTRMSLVDQLMDLEEAA